MASDFSFSRDFQNVKWGATLRYNMLRALCAGLVFSAVGLLFFTQGPKSKDTLSFLLIAWIIIPIGYPFFFLPLGLLLNFLGNLFAPFRLPAFGFSLMIAIGDPLVFFLHKAYRNLVPVRTPGFFNLQMVIFVLDEGPDPASVNDESENHVEPEARAEPNIYREPQLVSAPDLPRSRNNNPTRSAVRPAILPQSRVEPGSVEHLLKLSQSEPEEALDWIERMPSEIRNKATISFAKFMALRTLALKDLIGWANLPSIEIDELRQFVTPGTGKYLVRALRQISELERQHPGYIARLKEGDNDFGESSVDDVCIVVERLFPGKIQEILGWTKILYFGIDRVGFAPRVGQIPNDELRILLSTRFRIAEIARSAVAIAYGKRGRERSGYIDFCLCRLLYGDFDTLKDAETLGTLRLSDNSDFSFTPW